MGLPKIIQIPCHHVLANQNDLKFKKGAPLKQFFNINLGIGIIRKLFFCSYFRHISLCFYSNFDQEILLDAEFDCTSNEYPLDILLMDLTTQKKEIPEKTWWCLIPHPTRSPDRNLSKNTGRYVKNTNKNVFFFFSSSKINKYYFNILSIILLIFLRRPILSWNFL